MSVYMFSIVNKMFLLKDLDKRRKSQGETSDSFKENSLPKSKKSAGQSSPAVVTFDNDGDNVSESGTYTIDSDNPSKDVMEARENIEEVFGIAKDETSDADTDKDVSDEEIAEQVVENKVRRKNYRKAFRLKLITGYHTWEVVNFNWGRR